MHDTAFEPFNGHTDHILTLVYSPDGLFIATGSRDSTIRIWEANTGRRVGKPLEGHTHRVRAIAYSPNGQCLVSGPLDKTLRVWNMGTHQTAMGPLEGHGDYVLAAQYSPDGELIASGGRDNLLKLWDAHVGDCIATLQHPTHVNSVSFSPNSKNIVTACDDLLIRIYDVDQHQLIREISGHQGRVRCVQYSPDGSLIASASNDYTIRLWDSSTGNLVNRPLRGHRRRVSCVSFSYDGQQLVSSSHDESVRVWNVASGECISGPLYGHKDLVRAVSCSASQGRFASCSSTSVRIWDIHNGASVLPQSVTESDTYITNQYSMKAYAAVWAVAWFSDGKHFASAGGDHGIRIYDSQTGQESAGPLMGHDRRVNAIDISRNDELLASAGSSGIVSVWDLKTQDLSLVPFSGHNGAIWSIKFILNDTRIITGGSDKTIRVWDVQSGVSLHVIQAHSDYVRTLSISPDGSQFASGSSDKTVCVWDIYSCEMLRKPLKCEGRVASVCYSPDGSQLLTGSWDGMTCLWNVSRGEKVAVFKHEDDVRCVQFSADGSKIVSASHDNKVCVWEAGIGKLLHAWLHDDWATVAAFSPDGERVVSGSRNGDLYMWDVNTGLLLSPKRLVGPNRSIEAGDLKFMNRRDLTVFTRAFRRFLGNNADNNTQTKSSDLSTLKDGDGIEDQENYENMTETIDVPTQGSQVTTTLSLQESLENVEATGGDKGKTQERRSDLPVSQSSDSLGSFMNRPAVVINKNNSKGMNDFFDDVETNNSTQELSLPEESPQQDAQDLKQGMIAIIVLRSFAWVRDHVLGRCADVAIDACVPETTPHSATARTQLRNAATVLRQAMNRVVRLRGKDIVKERESDPQSYRMTTLHGRSSRRMVIISPAWANLRIFASGETPGRHPGGNTQPVENDVDDDDTDSMISEESYGPVVDALCFCNCSRLLARRRTVSNPARRHTGSSSAPEKTSTNQAPVCGLTNQIPTQNQVGSAPSLLRGDEPVALQPRPARMQTKSPSKGEHVQPLSVCVRTVGS